MHNVNIIRQSPKSDSGPASERADEPNGDGQQGKAAEETDAIWRSFQVLWLYFALMNRRKLNVTEQHVHKIDFFMENTERCSGKCCCKIENREVILLLALSFPRSIAINGSLPAGISQNRRPSRCPQTSNLHCPCGNTILHTFVPEAKPTCRQALPKMLISDWKWVVVGILTIVFYNILVAWIV